MNWVSTERSTDPFERPVSPPRCVKSRGLTWRHVSQVVLKRRTYVIVLLLHISRDAPCSGSGSHFLLLKSDKQGGKLVTPVQLIYLETPVRSVASFSSTRQTQGTQEQPSLWIFSQISCCAPAFTSWLHEVMLGCSEIM